MRIVRNRITGKWFFVLTLCVGSFMFCLFCSSSPAFASAQDEFDAAVADIAKFEKLYDEAVSERDDCQRQIDGMDERIRNLGYGVLADSLLDDYSRAMKRKQHGDIVIGFVMASTRHFELVTHRSSYGEVLESSANLHRKLREHRTELVERRTNAVKSIQEASEGRIAAVRAKMDAEQRIIQEEEERRRAMEASRNGFYASIADIDEASAKAFIIQRESGGNYYATNGRYYGAYQLDISYLGGDTSPANQDRVAEEYVANRYGSWQNAYGHWQSHGWY